jgi:hypothetical protein
VEKNVCAAPTASAIRSCACAGIPRDIRRSSRLLEGEQIGRERIHTDHVGHPRVGTAALLVARWREREAAVFPV